MRYFHGKLTSNDWSNKHNFIDENNVVVGYDSEQSCCEDAGFYITAKEPLFYDAEDDPEGSVEPDDATLLPYRIDPAYFRELGEAKKYDLDSGGAVAFRLTAPEKPDLYLVLFNSHNGYYGHGFTVSIGGTVTRTDSL